MAMFQVKFHSTLTALTGSLVSHQRNSVPVTTLKQLYTVKTDEPSSEAKLDKCWQEKFIPLWFLLSFHGLDVFMKFCPQLCSVNTQSLVWVSITLVVPLFISNLRSMQTVYPFVLSVITQVTFLYIFFAIFSLVLFHSEDICCNHMESGRWFTFWAAQETQSLTEWQDSKTNKMY